MRPLSDTLQAHHPEVPWRQLRGMRNILAHDYGEIDHDIIYTTATRDLPALTAALSVIVLKSS